MKYNAPFFGINYQHLTVLSIYFKEDMVTVCINCQISDCLTLVGKLHVTCSVSKLSSFSYSCSPVLNKAVYPLTSSRLARCSRVTCESETNRSECWSRLTDSQSKIHSLTLPCCHSLAKCIGARDIVCCYCPTPIYFVV